MSSTCRVRVKLSKKTRSVIYPVAVSTNQKRRRKPKQGKKTKQKLNSVKMNWKLNCDCVERVVKMVQQLCKQSYHSLTRRNVDESIFDMFCIIHNLKPASC